VVPPKTSPVQRSATPTGLKRNSSRYRRPPQRIGDKGEHLPGEEICFVLKRRASGERKCYFADVPAEADLETLAATIKARRVYEQARNNFTI